MKKIIATVTMLTITNGAFAQDAIRVIRYENFVEWVTNILLLLIFIEVSRTLGKINKLIKIIKEKSK